MPNALYKSYMICTSPRSGSTLLCKLLAATGQAGNPDSHFHKPSIDSWLKAYQLDGENFVSKRETLEAIFGAAIKRGKGDTGVFGLRLQRGSFDFFMQQLRILYPDQESDPKRIEAAFGKTLFIYLSRPNKLDQAISRTKAEQTGLWHMAPDGAEIERLSDPKEPFYDPDRIAHHIAELSELEKAWKAWFEKEKLQPFRISYDELSDDPNKVLARVLDALGLDGTMARTISLPVAKLADETNQIWAERFLAEKDVDGFMPLD